eukprot:TRINITY_DN27726_c0_g1_i3.p1 TRINITY_DN27726_c0_g1~~TRINITY_DN27726_c0_g1_i3.p1  ORF type:complete len:652 (-),score=129.79 TRINITY_DN27726_c0_g1_i3:85-2040(-)
MWNHSVVPGTDGVPVAPMGEPVGWRLGQGFGPRRWWPGDHVESRRRDIPSPCMYMQNGASGDGAVVPPNFVCNGEGGDRSCRVVAVPCGADAGSSSYDLKTALLDIHKAIEEKITTQTVHFDQRFDRQSELLHAICKRGDVTWSTKAHPKIGPQRVTCENMQDIAPRRSVASTVSEKEEIVTGSVVGAEVLTSGDVATGTVTDGEQDTPMKNKRGAILAEIGSLSAEETFAQAVKSSADTTAWRPKGRSEGRPIDKTDELWIDGEEGIYVYLREFKNFVKSNRFDHIMGGVIVFNTLFLGIQIDIKARSLDGGGDPADPRWILTLETLFTIIFFLELVARCIAFHPWFCCSAWNVFDTVVVLSAILEEIQKYSEEGNSFLGTLRAFKMIRVLKLLRALRIIRVVRAFRELRIVLMSIVNALRQLFWTLSLLFVLIYMVSILVLVELTGTSDPYEATHFGDIRKRYFSDLLRTLMTVFQCTTYGALWEEATRPLEEVVPMLGPVWMLYMGFVVFAFQNTVTGMCVDLAMKMEREDARNVMLEEHEAREKVQVNLRQSFVDCDPECKGFFTRKALLQLCRDEDFSLLLKDCDIDSRDIVAFYDQLTGMPGVLNIADVDLFVQGCFRLKGVATSVDVMSLAFRQKKVLAKVDTF